MGVEHLRVEEYVQVQNILLSGLSDSGGRFRDAVVPNSARVPTDSDTLIFMTSSSRHGGRYGFARAPLKRKIYFALFFTGSLFRVLLFKREVIVRGCPGGV